MTLRWVDNSNNETGFTIQWSRDAGFSAISGTANVGTNATTYVTGSIAQVTWSFRILANNVLGSSAWVTTAGIQPAAVINNGPTSPLEFWDDFEFGLSSWTGQVGGVHTSSEAAMGGYGWSGLSVPWGVDEIETEMQPAYVFHQTAIPLGSIMANFYFNPNGVVTSATPIDIFTGMDAQGNEIFGVQYLHKAAVPDLFQIRAWVRTDLVDLPTEWVSINNVEQNLQLDWQSDQTSSLNLYVNGDLVANVAGDSSSFQLTEERLGAYRGMESIDTTAVGLASISFTTLYLDEFFSLSTDVTSPFEPIPIVSVFLPIVVH